FATINANMADLTAQGKGNGSLGLMFDVAGGTLLDCCVGVATAPDQIAPQNIYAVAYVKRSGALTPAGLKAPNPVLKIWRGSDQFAGPALALYGGDDTGAPRASSKNYFYFGWADSIGNTTAPGKHADVTYYYNLIYSRALGDAEWIRLYTYLKSA